jgi:outer membrane protein TolC
MSGQTRMSLAEAIDTALKNNFDIRISRIEAGKDQANNTAGNAGMLPSLALNGSTNYNNTLSNPAVSALGGAAYLQLDWTLYDGGKMFVTRQKLREAASLGDLRFRETVQAKMYEVVANYYNLLRLQQQLRAIQQTIRYNRERVTIAQTGFNSGALAKPDLLQAKTDLNEVLESAVAQEFAIREAKRSMNTLLGFDTEKPFDIEDSIPNRYEPDRKKMAETLNASNTSLLALQKQVEISKLAFKESLSNYLPKVGLSANFLLTGIYDLTNSGGDRQSYGPNVGASVNIPLYSGGENNRKRTVAKLTVESTQAELDRLRLDMNLALQNALNDFDNQKALLKMEEENNLMTKEYLEISIERLRLGQTNSLEVHLAQEKYMNSNARLINFRFNLKLAETKLKQLVAAL